MKEMIRNLEILAQQIEALRSGTNNPGATLSGHKSASAEPVSLENSAPVVLEIKDLRHEEVTRLIEQVDQHNRDTLAP